MTFYVKVPPKEGKYACVYKFENTRMKKSVFEYDSITMYSGVKFNQQWFDDNLVNKRLTYKAFEQQFKNDKESQIVVTSAGFNEREIFFSAPLIQYDIKIPLVDQMICAYYKINPRRIIYQKANVNIKTNTGESKTSREAMLFLLGKQLNNLTSRERKELNL